MAFIFMVFWEIYIYIISYLNKFPTRELWILAALALMEAGTYFFFKTTCPKSCHGCLHVKASSNRTKQNPPTSCKSWAPWVLKENVAKNTTNAWAKFIDEWHQPTSKNAQISAGLPFWSTLCVFAKRTFYRERFFGGSHSVSDRTLNGSPDPKDVTK